MSASPPDQTAMMQEILDSLKNLQVNQVQLASNVDAITGRVNVLAGMKEVRDVAAAEPTTASKPAEPVPKDGESPLKDADVPQSPSLPAAKLDAEIPIPGSPQKASTSTGTSRIILTTYPGQSGINPLPMDWGHKDPQERGPVVVSRNPETVRRPHGGSYSIYYALAVASKEIKSDHKPDFTNTEPAANIGPFPQWADKKKIVSMDPLGHLAPWLFKDTIEKENNPRSLPELETSVREGRLVPDGKICLNESGELAVTKFAVEPVWYLPGVAERFGIGL
ncbi:gtp cyclohydrolase ii protein [Rutstroemia sp. NJR-2017a WRK4]|nr:gtp cyclohydrolase ii protein [Rutstroemia sp. NJR-2017a WRK4]